MKKIDLGQTITILANLGVIAGIVFLAVELRQNNALLQAQSRSDQNDRIISNVEAVYQNTDLATAVAKARPESPKVATQPCLPMPWMACSAGARSSI